MFVNPTNKVGLTHRVVAMLAALAVTLLYSGVYSSVAEAANLTNVSDTLSTSAPSQNANHSIKFTVPAGSAITATGTITISFPVEFNLTSLVRGTDVAITGVGGTPAYSGAGQNITITGVTAAALANVTVAITNNHIQNPATVESYEIVVSTDQGDLGRTRVAIVDEVLVTARVDTVFDFVVAGVSSTQAVGLDTTDLASTPNTLAFGTIDSSKAFTMAQDLSVKTNAIHGFVVTVEKDGEFESSTGAIIDGFKDGTDVNVPEAWAAPTASIASDLTWGHWGMTTTNGINGDEFAGGDEWVAVQDNARLIFAYDGPVDGSVGGGNNPEGQARIGYKVQITDYQEAADDYSTILTYIATPTF